MNDDELFDAAVDLLPEAFFLDIEKDALAEGFAGVTLVAGADGLNAPTIHRARAHFAARDGDADWEVMPSGRQLDEVFPTYCGIGAFELLGELGLDAVYVRGDAHRCQTAEQG